MGTLSFIEQLLIILGASLVTTILFRRLKLPPIVAYIVVGSLVGPHFMGWIPDPGSFSLIAEFGVAFLLFSIGLEFSLTKMLTLRFAVFGLGSTQVIACSLVFAVAVYLWGTTLEAAIIIAGALALSSTAIVTHELNTEQQFHSHYAQLCIGVLLFQDLIAIIFLILATVLGNGASESFGQILLSSMGRGILFFILLMAVGKWVLPHIYNEVARANSDEIFVLSTLVIVLLATWLTHEFGLSMALGGFVIGMMLSESSFKHQIVNDIRPFRDILLGLFFVVVGMNIELPLLQTYWFRLVVFTLALISIKAFVVAFVVRLSGEPNATSFRVGITLAQAGEFGLALIALAQINNVIPTDQGTFIILIAVFSMLLSPILIRHSERIARYLLAHLPGVNADDGEEMPRTILHQSDHVIVGGFGRVGQTVAHLLNSNGIPYIGIDQDVDLVSVCKKHGQNVVYGDCTKLGILESCHIATTRLAILTFRSIELASNTIRQIRKKNINVPIIVRCYEHGDFEELISMGADWVIPEMLEASLTISSQVLTILEVEPHLIEQQIEELRSRNLGIHRKHAVTP